MNVLNTPRVSVRQLVYELIPDLRDHSPRQPVSRHEIAKYRLYRAMESLFRGGLDEETVSRIMRGFFADYINKNRIAEKAAAENCTTMEYLGLDEIEVFCLMGEVEE